MMMIVHPHFVASPPLYKWYNDGNESSGNVSNYKYTIEGMNVYLLQARRVWKQFCLCLTFLLALLLYHLALVRVRIFDLLGKHEAVDQVAILVVASSGISSLIGGGGGGGVLGVGWWW